MRIRPLIGERTGTRSAGALSEVAAEYRKTVRAASSSYRATSTLKSAERLAALRARRDNARVQAALANLGATAQGTDNLLPPILAAVEAYATTGEICGVLRAEFGEYQPREL